MISQLAAWWRSRTAREQKLVQGAALFVLMVLIPAWAFFSATQFRDDAAARLATARQVQKDVARLGEGVQAAAANGNATLRDRVLSLAQANGLSPQTIEAADAARVRILFAPADSLMTYRWVEAIGQAGAMVVSSAIVRVGDSDLVTAEFEVAASP